jgi:UPF0755 protein
VIIVSVLFLIFDYSSPKDASDDSYKKFIVKQGETVKEISIRLEEEGLISSKTYFDIYAWREKIGKDIKAGSYELSASMTIKEIVEVISSKGLQDDKIVILEGWTIEEIASEYADFKLKYFNDKTEVELEKEFKAEAENVDNYQYSFLNGLPEGASLEGFLFPDTYELYQTAEPKDLIDKMLSNFNNKVDDDLRSEIKAQDKTLFDIINLAAIVQKEVLDDKEMRKVAGVYYNRLEIGKKLESDVTINYITGKNNPQPSFDDTRTESPYNTYLNEGLPPGPVGNPGLDAIKATVNPSSHDYFYFITRLDTGEAIFAKTAEEHIKNKNKFLK